MKKLLLLTAAVAIASVSVFATPSIAPLGAKAVKKEALRKNAAKKIRDIKNAPSLRTAQSRSEGTELEMNWGFCEDPYNAFQFDMFTVNQAIYVSEEELGQLAGARINAIVVGTPANPELLDEDTWEYANDIENVTVWLAYSLDGEHFAEATGRFEEVAFTWTTVALDEPYIIQADKPFYVGVTYDLNVIEVDGEKYSDDCGYVTDYAEPDFLDTNLIYTTITGLDEDWEFVYADTPGWHDLSYYFGNACIRINVTGENLPTNIASIADSYVPSFVSPTDEMQILLSVKNQGAETLETVDVCLEYGDGTKQTVTAPVSTYGWDWDFVPQPIEFNEYGILEVYFDAPEKEGYSEYTITIPTLNGSAANKASTSVKGWILSLSEGFHKNNVVEEGTGTWCGNCPFGYVGMKWLAENCEDFAIGIALHYEDPMSVFDPGQAFEEFCDYIEGYPSAFINRNWGYDVYPSPDNLEDEMMMIEDIPALAQISAAISTVSDDGKKIKLETTVEFSVNDDSESFGVAYTVVEDGVGPYLQENYMSGEDPGSAYGFEDLPEQVELIFDDVARNCSHPQPIDNSLPAEIKPGEKYNFSTEIELTDVSNLDNYRVVPMVVNRKTGFIENACVVKSPTYSYSGLKAVESEKTPATIVRGGKGMIIVNGQTENAKVYGVDGRFICTLTAQRTAIAPGFYIVTIGNEATKVFVK